MTGRTQARMSDARLDRLIAQVLENRADDIAAATVPADTMASRVSATLRPAYLRPIWRPGLRLTLVVMLMVGLLLAAVVAASLVGSRPATTAPATFICGSWPPATGHAADAVLVVDATGSMHGCRGIVNPPDVGEFTSGNVDIVPRDGGVDVAWLAAGCDGDARLDVRGDASSHLEIAVTQTRTEPCGGGMGVRTIRLELAAVLNPRAVSGSLTYSSDSP